jgi:hypothetical protein
MASKKVNYIELELEWLEARAEELKRYCDSNPISHLRDRVLDRKVTATIEQQITSIRNTLQDYIKIIEAISKLREREETKKISSRGNQELTPFETGEI